MKNLTSVEYLRAFSMLYIAGYWHSLGYANISFGQSQSFMWLVTYMVMALFVFTSGFFVGGKKSRQMSAKQFYLRRLMRIYPLYALAIALYYIVGINDGWTLLKALLGLSMYMEPPPYTLWFVSMLVLFYLVTPLLLTLVDKVWVFSALIGLLMVITLALEVAIGTVDLRLLLYFPAFCLGVFCANHGLSNRFTNATLATLCLLPAIPLAFIELPLETLNFLKVTPLITLVAYLVFNGCYQNEQRFKPRKVISFLSYSSFAMYLFHRPVFSAMKALYFPPTEVLQVLYLTTLCLLVIAVVSWSLQKFYDTAYGALAVKRQPAQKALT